MGVTKRKSDNNEQVQKKLRTESGIPLMKTFSQQHQLILMRFLLKHSGDENVDNWKLFTKWLSMPDVSRSHGVYVSQKDMFYILEALTKRFDDYANVSQNEKTSLVDALCCVIMHPIFRQYFHQNLQAYCKIISVSTSHVQDSADVLRLLKANSVLIKYATVDDDFSLYFMKTMFIPLVKIAAKFEHESDVFEEVLSSVQKCLFTKTHQDLVSLNSTSGIEVSDYFLSLLDVIVSLYNEENNLARCAHKLIFRCVCGRFAGDTKKLYRYLIVLIDHLGFRLTKMFRVKNSVKLPHGDLTLSFSVDVLANTFDILAKHQFTLDNNFTDFLKNILLSVINVALTPNSQVYSIFHSIISINPLILEQIVSDVLIYLMVEQHFSLESQANSEKFMILIFQVFSKLHRIEKLVHFLVHSLKSGLLEVESPPREKVFTFQGKNDITGEKAGLLLNVENVLSEIVLQAFSQQLVSLASWQIINIFKTFNYHLSEALNLTNTDERFQCYMEMLSALFCCFLSSVRVAEHTVSSAVQEKFLKAMEELKVNLRRFGKALLHKEHNHALMRAYLNVCYMWGEVCIMAAYYSPDMSSLVGKTEDYDYSPCNLVYLHDYLSGDQWSMIEQRITNFGEIPCKHIMHKLYVQKLKAMHVFNASCFGEMKRSFTDSVVSETHATWLVLFQEPFVLKHLLPEMNHETILSAADSVLKSCSADGNYLMRKDSLVNCGSLMRAAVYGILRKINVLFKKKGGDAGMFFGRELFRQINVAEFVADEELKELPLSFNQLLQQNWTTNCKVDAEKLNAYLNILKQLPVVHLSNNVHDAVTLYLIALLFDCQNGFKDGETKANLECVVNGLVVRNPSVLPKIVPFDLLFAKIVPLFVGWEDVLPTLLHWSAKNFETLQKLEKGIDCVLAFDNEKLLRWSVVILNVANHAKRGKLNQESKRLLMQYVVRICEKICSLLGTVDMNTSMEAYAVVLKFYFEQDRMSSLNSVVKELKPYLDHTIACLENGNLIKGSLLLLIAAFRNKSKLENFERSLLLKTWEGIKQIPANINDKEHLELCVLIFEYATEEEFISVSRDLFQLTSGTLHGKHFEKYAHYIEIWNSLAGCCFKPEKTKIWQETVERLLKEQHQCLLHSSEELMIQKTAKFHARIVQAVLVPLTTTAIDMILSTVAVFVTNAKSDLSQSFLLSTKIMESLLKHRSSITMDRLPIFLQQYRHLLKKLCVCANYELNLKRAQVQDLAGSAHMLEKLTNDLVYNRRHVTRIAPYLIADFLHHFERVTLCQDVKNHLNNCLYQLMSVLDHHAISYLMRVLSTASTEMFKILFEYYRKHHRFTGKV